MGVQVPPGAPMKTRWVYPISFSLMNLCWDLNPKGPRRGERVQWTLKQPCVQASCKGSRRTADSRSEYVGVPPGKILTPAVDRHVLKHCGPDLGRGFKIVKGLFLAAILFLDIWKRPNFKARKIKDLNSSQFGRFGALPF